MRIRRATATDIDAVRRCVEAAYAPYLERMATPPAPMLDDYTALIARGVVDVAIEPTERIESTDSTERLVGLIVSWPVDGRLFIDNVAVDPAAHGAGCGTLLLDHAEAAARRAGLTALFLYTNVAMTENLTYYPRRGFTEIDRRTEDGYDRVYFERPVGRHNVDS